MPLVTPLVEFSNNNKNMLLHQKPAFWWNLKTKAVFHPQTGKAIGLVPAFVVCEAFESSRAAKEDPAKASFSEAELIVVLEEAGWKRLASRVRCGDWRPYDPPAAGLLPTTFVCYTPVVDKADARLEWFGILIEQKVPHPDAEKLAEKKKAQELEETVGQAELKHNREYTSGSSAFSPMPIIGMTCRFCAELAYHAVLDYPLQFLRDALEQIIK